MSNVYRDELSREARSLSDPNSTLMGNSALPTSVVRSVIREALSDLTVLEICNVVVDATMGFTIQIPYETRLPGSILNDGIYFEGDEIPLSSVRQDMATAYVQAMKLGFAISNELDFFSRNGMIDWNALDRLVASNAWIIKTRIHMRIANEMQRASDAFQAETVSAENIASQLTGSNSLIKTTRFPVVKPHQTRDIRGTAIGSEENPLTLIVNGAAVPAFDGSGTQAAGIYFIAESLNLGYFRLVNQVGAAVTPIAVSAVISYSAATNVAFFDMKLPDGIKLSDHLNGALRVIEERQSMMHHERHLNTDFVLGGPILINELSWATSFQEMDRRRATEAGKDGQCAFIKAMPVFCSNAPGVNFGDERLMIGVKGSCTYAISKPWSTTPPFEAVGPNRKPTGEKLAYGEEYNAIIVPHPLRGQLTSVICYDSDARAAAV